MTEARGDDLTFLRSHAEVAHIGFRSGAQGTHTSRTIMFHEIDLVMAAAHQDARRDDYADAIIEANCLAKPTAATRRLSNQRLGEIYALDPRVPIFRVFRRLWGLDAASHRLLALLMGLARDPLLAATASSVLTLPVGAEFQRGPMKQALRTAVDDRLSDNTLDKVARNAASSWTQSGHLEGRTFKHRRAVTPTPAAAAFAIYLAYSAGSRGIDIFSSAWLRAIDCDPSRARQLALEAKQVGLIDLRTAGDVIELSFARLDPDGSRR
jgi:hypothetical protein